MKVVHTSKSGKVLDITQLVSSMTISRDNEAIARVLDLKVVYYPLDYYLPKVTLETGEMIQLFREDNSKFFEGYIWKVSSKYNSGYNDYIVFSKEIYLDKDIVPIKLTSKDLSSIVGVALEGSGIAVGSLPSGSVEIDKIHLDKTRYGLIKEACTLLKGTTDKDYHIYIEDNKLNIEELGTRESNFAISSATNLIESTYSKDISGVINNIKILDKNGKQIQEIKDDASIKEHGIFTDVLVLDNDEDKAKIQNEAKSKVQKADMQMQVEVTADIDLYSKTDALLDLVTGKAVEVEDNYSNIKAKFNIISDKHIFSNSKHTVQLTLDFKEVI